MKITNVTTFIIPPEPTADGWSEGSPVVFVKLETDEGLTGWGEAYVFTYREKAIREIIVNLGEAVKQMPNASPRAFRDNIAKPMDTKHPGIDFSSAVSAVEMALWDLLGKQTGLPLHALLGGALVERIPLYANAWDQPVQKPEAIAERCAGMREEGYFAVKIYPLRQPTLSDAEACVRLTREAIGPDADMMLDFAIQEEPRHAVEAVRLFEPYNPYWIEEPLAGDDLDALAEFRAKTDCRVVTGERQSGKRHYRNVLDKRAADILNPDIAGAGGILEMLEVGAMAQAHSVMMSPHCWDSTTVAFHAMLHVCAVMPNAIYAELFYDYLALGDVLAKNGYAIEDGYASLPQKPGLGVEMNEEELVRRAV